MWIRTDSIASMSTNYGLMSTSTDGKIMLWKPENKLRYPVKGHLLARKKGGGGELAIIGGTSLCKAANDDNTYVVGTEGGSIFKCNISLPNEKDISHLFEGSKVRWKAEAMYLLSNLPSKSVLEIKKKVERYVQDKGERDVFAHTVFHAKPELRLIFTIPFSANYEKHLAPITGCECSPFVKRLFLTCSQDGMLRLFDVLNNRPIAIFEPGSNEYLLDCEWSPFRPAVFASVSNKGSLYLYDLLQSKKSPV